MTASLIQMESVSKVYATDALETHVLSAIDLEIRDGEFVEVMGPSGCGKSTLLAVVGLLDRPSEGHYYLDGVRVDGLSSVDTARIRNQHIGFIFQAFNLISDLTVFENIELPLTYRRMTAADRRKKVDSLLDRIDMAHRSDHYPSQLSGGQQQRVAVARAVVGDPLVVLADEPTGSLDSESGDAVMQLLHELNEEGSTILMVTHDPRYSSYANRTVRLFDGQITPSGGDPRASPT